MAFTVNFSGREKGAVMEILLTFFSVLVDLLTISVLPKRYKALIFSEKISVAREFLKRVQILKHF